MNKVKASNPIIFFVMAVALITTANFSCQYLTVENVEFTVTDKERITDKEGDSKYLVFTDIETFQCSDSVPHWKFNSSDQYGLMKRKKRYAAKVCGFRIPFFSTYRNIISASELKGDLKGK